MLNVEFENIDYLIYTNYLCAVHSRKVQKHLIIFVVINNWETRLSYISNETIILYTSQFYSAKMEHSRGVTTFSNKNFFFFYLLDDSMYYILIFFSSV